MNRKRSEEEGIREKSMQYKIHVGESLHPFTLSKQYGIWERKNVHIYTTFDSLVGWADVPGGRRDELPPGPAHGSSAAVLERNERLVASASAAASSADSEIGHVIGEIKGVAVELVIISDTRKGKG